MVAFAIPLIESAVAALGGWLLRAAAVIAGAGVAQMAGKKKDDTRARTSAQELTRDDRTCKDCPPRAGYRGRATHFMNPPPREYQGRVTGWPYSVEQGWSEEWEWGGTWFDAFVSDPCLIKEAKANYDQFLSTDWFTGFRPMREQIVKHGALAKLNPPTRVRYYFQGAGTLAAMRKLLLRNGVEFEHYP
ncbi:Tox-REase-5 domain-containing protein [Thiomonas sp. FB-6]|uniref:Tox-REase-5 domain-containing protein n=1 Tax=Thiomonas sp. FB-6 TaxID=1158291 RepID=UPI0003783F9C|nr:Tox-REase-5 domain-containing protein [Thiomonas sp. FB-6]